ncbi:DUF1833 domain-containing protein [Halomonas eurihalina]|uniref:DUF1833 domain-containing protein n=1 Tax=Halomonas eurihalina TaxID=42566 RepID=A0A5D9DBK4_HALER|nr:DUF1833 family protein [Halomonas eurihalina]MDR5858225.1 DUF1833 family protein [Halomonas eurihalina]TZG41278.1 DUF1833 domain-containing protein [Halomonas eurihalina]
MDDLLETVYASALSGHVRIDTLEIISPSQTIRICDGYEDHVVTLETGETVGFLASAMKVVLPERNASGQQPLTFAVENVTGEAERAIDAALADGIPVDVIYREYLSSDLSAPAKPPIQFVLYDADFEDARAQLTSSFFDIIGTGYPRERYTVQRFPGLKHIG